MSRILDDYVEGLCQDKMVCGGKLYSHTIRERTLDFWKALTHKHGDTTIRHIDAILAVKSRALAGVLREEGEG